MEFSDHLKKSVEKSAKTSAKTSADDVSNPSAEKPLIDSAVGLLRNIAETACEQELDLDLNRLVNLIDLYRAYLQMVEESQSDFRAYVNSISGPSDAVLTQSLGDTQLVSFERFVRDSRLLGIAASAAAQQSGESVATPFPLAISANC